MRLLLRKKKGLVILLLAGLTGTLTRCISVQDKPVIANSKGEVFAGSEKCASCHKEVFEGFTHTAHYITSQNATSETVKGSFEKGKNIYNYSFYGGVAMEQTDSGLYQVEFYRGKEKERRRFDVIIGSGTRGQSFVSWHGNKLYQLPISYFTNAGTWANSPGYSNFAPEFKRIVTTRCMECHSTYLKDMSAVNGLNTFDKNTLITGVQCESCHGPGQKHIDYHEKNTTQTKGQYIIGTTQFSREQKLDLCAYCHGGNRAISKAAFEFTPGDTLFDSKGLNDSAVMHTALDVHGNPYGLLVRSKCFKMDASLTCNTCHNTHKQERGELALFSSRCMTCHKENEGSFCKMAGLPVAALKANCIDCHMPQKQSLMLTLKLEGVTTNKAAVMRSHLIAIYRDEAKKNASSPANMVTKGKH